MDGDPAARTALTRPAGSGSSKQAEIRSAVTQYIVVNALPAGAPLPTEPELMAELGVGRNALREAMKVLEALGIVEIRHGFGTYVGDSTLAALEGGLRYRTERSLRTDRVEIAELLEVREVLEVGLAARVVTDLTDADVDRLEELVVRMETAAGRGEHFPAEDWQFHEGLYAPLGNELVVDLLRVFWRVFSAVDADLPGPRYTPAAAASWHRDVLEAVRARDAVRAASSMEAHFQGIRERLGA